MHQTVVLIPLVSWAIYIESLRQPSTLSGLRGVIHQPRRMEKDIPLEDPYLVINSTEDRGLSPEDITLMAACMERVKSHGPVNSLIFKLEI